jgi:hypothetical protein
MRATRIVSTPSAADETLGTEKAGAQGAKSMRETIGINRRERYGQTGIAARTTGSEDALGTGSWKRADMAH